MRQVDRVEIGECRGDGVPSLPGHNGSTINTTLDTADHCFFRLCQAMSQPLYRAIGNMKGPHYRVFTSTIRGTTRNDGQPTLNRHYTEGLLWHRPQWRGGECEAG